jgi:hypothetical protein
MFTGELHTTGHGATMPELLFQPAILSLFLSF